MSTARAFFGGAASSSPSVYATGGVTNGSPTYIASTEELGVGTTGVIKTLTTS